MLPIGKHIYIEFHPSEALTEIQSISQWELELVTQSEKQLQKEVCWYDLVCYVGFVSTKSSCELHGCMVED